MAYTEEVVHAKLSALSETQDSVVTAAQWVMYHKRYADRTARLWLQQMKSSSNSTKKLNLIYLANEVVQQSKIRKKDEFVNAFSPFIVEATSIAAKGASNDVLQKVRRVVEVWRSRQIFESALQDAVEACLDDVDKTQTRAPAKKPLLGGSLFSDLSSGIPTELQPLIPLQQAVSMASIAANPLTTKADSEYATLNDGSQPTPSPPKHAACLSALVKSLASAEDAVAECLKARKAIVAALELLLETNQAQLATVESQLEELSTRKESMASKRHEVEDQIMKGLSSEEKTEEVAPDDKFDPVTESTGLEAEEEDIGRPEIERFTPPPSHSMGSMGSAAQAAEQSGIDEHERPDYEELTPPPTLTPTPPVALYSAPAPAPSTFPSLGVVGDPRRRPRPSSMSGSANGVTSLKKRKLSTQEDELGDGADAMAGLDADVVGMLG